MAHLLSMVERMSDKLDKIGNFQNRTALGISLGLACSIPLAAPAMARPDADQMAARQALRQQNMLERNERREIRLQNLEARGGGANFNLNSGRAVFSAGNLGNFTNLTINVGGKDKVIDLNSKLTAAELVAAQQVLNGGSQSIQISRNGAADGGTIALNTNVLTGLEASVGGNIASMTVARGVQVVDNNSGIDLSGTLRNFGTISAANVATGATNTIAADTIINGRGGAIESYNGADLFAADVALNASTSVTNNGRISSNGNLTITAPVINNVADGGSSPSMTAGQNVNLNTANLVNDGLIAANAGNINVTASAALLAGGSGTLQADNGSINFNTTNNDITVSGGNLLSQSVNFNSGADGKINATFGEATGVVNAEGCVIHLYADSQDLNLGVITAFGDPIITNTGNIQITAAITATNGAPLTLIAGGNIVSNAGNTGLNTSSAVGDGGDLSLIAGATFKTDKKTGNIVVSKKSKTGGLIDLTGGNGGTGVITGVNTSSLTGDAGDIQMVAFAAKTVGSGSVILPTGVTITATGATGDGSVTIIGSTKEGTSVSAGDINAGAVTIGSGTPGAPKGGVAFDPTTGALLSAPFTVKTATAGTVDLNGSITATGDVNVTTGGALNVLGQLGADPESTNMNITAGTLNVAGGGSITSDDAEIVTIKVSDAATVDGIIAAGQVTMTADSLSIGAAGAMADAVDNITTKGNIQVDGQFGRNPDTFDPNRATTTFNVVAGGAFNVSGSGNVSGDGAITGSTIQNDGVAQGSITYTSESKKAGGFVNNGLIDGLNVTVNAFSIQNGPAAQLQATLQTNSEDIPTLTLNTTSINNLGLIGAVGVAKQSEGVLSINSTKGLTITGDDGSFFTDFNGTISLTAAGDIVVGGNDGVTNSNPFSNINNNLGVFNVETTGVYKSVQTDYTVTSDGEGNYGTINILAKGVEYNGLGVAPVYNLTATGDVESTGEAPVSIEITGKDGITLGGAPGNFNVVVSGFDATNTNSFVTPTNLNVNMANLILNNTGLNLEGTKNLLITGNVVGGENVTITTANKKAFLIGNATTTGQTGIAVGEGISATKNLTINAPGKITINTGAVLSSGEDVTLNAPGLVVENGGDIAPFDPMVTLTVTLNTGSSTKAEYTNLNANGLLSAAILQINSTGTLKLDSGGGNQVQTYLSMGINPDGADGLAGGGSFIITATDLKFSSKGIFFDVGSDAPLTPNGGEVDLNLSSTKTIKVGLGNGAIRADVNATAPISAEGSGKFTVSSVGAITATDVITGAIDFGFGGSFGLASSTSTVSAAQVGGKSYNLFQLVSNSATPLVLSEAGKNGIQDDISPFLNGVFGGNLTFTNNGGSVVTNNAKVIGVSLNILSSTLIDARENQNLQVVVNPSGDGGVMNLTAPQILVSNQTGLSLFAGSGPLSGAIVNVTTTSTTTTGNIIIDGPGIGGAINIDVSNAVGIGATVNVSAGNALKVSGTGLNFGTPGNSDGASLTLKSGQATDTYAGGALTFNNGNAIGLQGLAFGTITFNSGSRNAFLLNNANQNTGNGLSASGSTLAAGKVIIAPQTGKGIIDTSDYALTTNSLELTATTINFDNQTIAVVADGALGSGDNTGDGGTILINGADLRFSNQGGVLLRAQANPGVAGSVGGQITVNDTSTRVLELGADGFSFDVSNSGVGPGQKGGSITVSKTGNDLEVDASALTYGANDGGILDLTSSGSMLVSNIGSLNTFFLDKATFETQGGGVFSFGGATDNGFAGVNPTFTAKEVEIISSGANAGIDTSVGTVSANILTLKTSGNINFASGGTLSVLSNSVNNNGGSMYLTAAGFTQSGGNAGYTLQADSGGAGGAGGLIDITITGTDLFTIGAGGLNVDISNDGVSSAGGVFQISTGGSMNADFAAIDFGANFGGNGPNVSIIANGVLSVSNASLIANIGLGGGQFVNAGVQGTVADDNFQTITIFNAGLPGGQLDIMYVNQTGDTVVTIAEAFADLINSNTLLQNLGVSAIQDGAELTLRSTTAGTTYNVSYNPDPIYYDADGNPILEIDLTTFTTGLTLGSKSSQAFLLGGAAVGANGIQDNGLNLNVGAISIINTGLSTSATIGGVVKAGTTDSITVLDSRLIDGSVTVSYTFVEGDTRDTIAAALASAINTNVALQGIGVTATTTDSVINLSATGIDTSFSAEAGKSSKITLATVAEGGDILQGTLLSLSGPGTTGPVNLSASGNVGAAGDAITMTSGAGSLLVNAGLDAFVDVTGTVGTVTANVGGAANISFFGGDVGSINGTAGSLNFVYAGTAANNNAVGLSSFTTTNGDLVITSNARDLSLSGTINSNFGNIVIQNTSTNGGANIDIAASTEILGSGAVTALNQGNVYIVMGLAPPAFSPVDGTAPAGVTITETAGGQVTFGAAVSNPAGSITSDPTATFEALGRNLAFNTGTFGAGAITVGADAVITADPPAQSGSVAQILARIAAENGRTSTYGSRSASQSTSTVSTASTGFAGAALGNVSSELMSGISNSTTTGDNSIRVNAPQAVSSVLSALNATVSNASLSNLTNSNSLSNLSNIQFTTLNSATNRDTTTGVAGAMGIAESRNSALQQALNGGNQQAGTPMLNGEVSNVQHRSLERGPLLVSPQVDLVVDTPHGSVSVAAKSLALVIANDNGVAVYNLHDHRKSAVKLTRNGHTVHVTPGTTAMFFHENAGSFEDINPAAFVLYRQPTAKVHNNAKLYRAEFEVISLLNALPAFKEMMASESDETRKQMVNVLKTAAILMQLKTGGEAFKTFIKPEVTASAK
jgi:hypothetical protein